MQTTRNFLLTFFIFIMVMSASGISPLSDCAANAAPDAARQCAYTLVPISQAVVAAGGAFNVTVTTASGCNWMAASNDAWIGINSGGSGSGNGAVNFTVAPNTSTNSRGGAPRSRRYANLRANRPL